ncbi:Uncharacterised protein [Klebsiella pneumoniae]|nr:Uncharacterised protein [Klebsiella pneumoniae]
MVSGHNHQCITMFFRVFHTDLYRFIQRDSFADLAAGVCRVILFIDRGAFHL